MKAATLEPNQKAHGANDGTTTSVIWNIAVTSITIGILTDNAEVNKREEVGHI